MWGLGNCAMALEIIARSMGGGLRTEVWGTPLWAQSEGQKEGRESC